jgi:hypothetical protein
VKGEFLRARQREGAGQSLLHRLKRDDMFAACQHKATDCNLAHGSDGLSDHRIGVMADLTIGKEGVGPLDVTLVDVRPIDELWRDRAVSLAAGINRYSVLVCGTLTRCVG